MKPSFLPSFFPPSFPCFLFLSAAGEEVSASLFVCFAWYWGLNLRSHTFEAGALPLEPLYQLMVVASFNWG
jgi:hypothetical protein